MFRFSSFLIISILLTSCSMEAPKKEEGGSKKKSKEYTITFSNPTEIKKSGFLVYQVWASQNATNRFEEKMSSNSLLPKHCWNLLFYNTTNHESFLLDSNRQFLVESFFPFNDGDGAIFYQLKTEDTNNDGKITSFDDSYLYYSKPNGTELKQLSPSGYKLENWFHMDSGIILMNVSKGEEKETFQIDIFNDSSLTKLDRTKTINHLKKVFNTTWK